uniref:Coiled-coil domain-containing protein 102A n=1 Tax=Biomphalaria glabrata TaxID=6526 RepID=A0A2C9K322_BIOGL
MSKNQIPATGSGGVRGDVSFIRATSGSGPPVQNVPVASVSPEKFSPHHSSQVPPVGPKSSHDIPIQPHLYRQHHVQQRVPQQPLIQPSYLQPYHPDHMEPQQYIIKQPHGAGGASGDPVGRVPSHPGVEGWSDREEALSTELEEAKIRVAQMEKTMRWWSDCTSNWREKWNKARNERNKAREENRLLRTKLEAMAKELSKLKREKRDTLSDIEKAHDGNLSQTSSSLCHSQEKLVELSEKERTVLALSNEKESESFDDLSETSSSVSKPSKDQQEDRDADETDTVTTHEGSAPSESSIKVTEMSERLALMQEKQAQLEQTLAQSLHKVAQSAENVVEMQRRLDEANSTIQSERLEKCSHVKTIEKLQKELREAQSRLNEEAQGKQDLKMQKSTDSDLSLEGFDRLKEQHQEEIIRLTSDLEDETLSRTTMDKRVTELRRELERIQAENANEWAKREHLESDKLALERDNKKLRLQIADLEEEVKKHNQASISAVDLDLKTLQLEVFEKSKELSDLKHVHSKLKKVLTERNTELEHTRRRAEMYEAEVRKLRSRVDELKHDLGVAEDEVDKQGNAARKAQRASDELQAQVESLQVQVNHLQSRLRRSTNIPPPRSTSLKSLTLEDSTDQADSENDFEDFC